MSTSKKGGKYSEDGHLAGKSEEVKTLYHELKARIQSFGEDIRIEPRELYVYFAAKTGFVAFQINDKEIILDIQLGKGQLDDPKKIARAINYNNAHYRVNVKLGDDLSYITGLIHQSYEKHSTRGGRLLLPTTTIRLREDTYGALKRYVENGAYGLGSFDEAINFIVNKESLFEQLLDKEPGLIKNVQQIMKQNKIANLEEQLAKLKGQVPTAPNDSPNVRLPRIDENDIRRH